MSSSSRDNMLYCKLGKLGGEMKRSAEEWALLNGYKIEQWVGDGDFGEAYLTTCGKILKVTSDKEEFVAASRIEGAEDEHLIEIYKTDSYNNDLVILMECLDTENIEDLFNEIINATGEDGIEALEFASSEDYDLSDEAHLLFSDLQSCIGGYQKNGTNPMDIHENNIGINSKGNYVLFDQKDKIADLSEELSMILEKKEKERVIEHLNTPSVKLNYSIKELEYESSEFNDKMRDLMIETIKRIEGQYKSLSTRHNKLTHPDIIFPDSADIVCYFSTNPEIEFNFNIHNEGGVLGFQAITTGDGLLGETEYMEHHALVILIDEEKYNDMKNNSFIMEDEEGFLENYLATITHEMSHIFEFIKNSGGLSPRDIDNLHETDDFEFNHFDCMTGYNILPMFDACNLDPDDALEIMEERVELKGQKMIKGLSLDNEIKTFLGNNAVNKKRKMSLK